MVWVAVRRTQERHFHTRARMHVPRSGERGPAQSLSRVLAFSSTQRGPLLWRARGPLGTGGGEGVWGRGGGITTEMRTGGIGSVRDPPDCR